MTQTSYYSKTSRGLAELASHELRLPENQYTLLGLVDGKSGVIELAGRSGLSLGNALLMFKALLAHGLLKEIFVKTDVVAALESGLTVTELDPEEGMREWEAAMRGLSAEGFFASTIKPLKPAGPPRILSVEDDTLMGKLLSSLLIRDGFAVRVAPDGQTAYQYLEKEAPDLVLLDAMLPDTTGFDILEWIRRHPTLNALPVVMVTAQVAEEDIRRGLAAGADGYICKPFKPEPLLHCIRDILKI
ncbi:MAG: response regulator [Sulfuricellaceae bacterium]|nr:response regulator [Sulfuricellaceae bacterium]